ncbi:MAG TPA: hypothetical protein PKD55_17580 [Bellilinea sp.]|nr:hypothetical protein [Bellilinea sp.]
MTADILSSVAGVILMLVFAYVPGLNARFAGLDSVYKRLAMLLLLFMVAAASFGLACVGWLTALFGLAITCDSPGLAELIRALIFAVMANQSAYQLLPETQTVKQAKLKRDRPQPDSDDFPLIG